MTAFGLKEACFIYQVIGHSIKSLLMTHEWVGRLFVVFLLCLEETVEGGSFGNHCLFLRRLGYARQVGQSEPAPIMVPSSS
jgi:hypothetical protein